MSWLTVLLFHTPALAWHALLLVGSELLLPWWWCVLSVCVFVCLPFACVTVSENKKEGVLGFHRCALAFTMAAKCLCLLQYVFALIATFLVCCCAWSFLQVERHCVRFQQLIARRESCSFLIAR